MTRATEARRGAAGLAAAACWALLAGVACTNAAPESPGLPPGGPAGGSAPLTPAAGSGAAGRGGTGPVAGASSGSAGTASAGTAGVDPNDAGADDSGAEPDDAADAAAAGGPPHSTGPGDWVAGDYPPNIMEQTYLEISGVAGQGSNVRQYKVHIPPGYDPSVPAPLVFCIHGLGQDALMFCLTGAAMHTKSDEAGFVLVMPNGYQNSWNAGTCCGAASSEGLDDVALFRAIFAEVGKHVNIDLDRVYATGLSNGGYMSYRLACEAADIFSAVGPGAGAIGTSEIGGGTNTASDLTRCEPSRPVSVLHIHGTEDPLIPYALQAPSLAQLAMQNGCSTRTRPATQPASAGDTTCVSYEGCPAGIEVTGCSIANGGHCWFGSEDCGTGGGAIGLAIVGANSDTMQSTAATWEFLERQHR